MKKVLISLDELKLFCRGGIAYFSSLLLPLEGKEKENFIIKTIESKAEEWFDSQPDITPTFQDYNAAKSFFKAAIPMLDEGLAKIEACISKVETAENE